MANVVDYLRRASERASDRRALVMGEGRSITFRALWERVDRLGAGLKQAGLEPGQRVILMVPMSIDLYVAMLAVLKMGAIGVFVDPWIGRRQIAAFSAFAEPHGWIGVGRSHLLRLMDRRLRAIPITVTTARTLGFTHARWTLGKLGQAAGDGRIYEATEDDPALVTFTSGSSGVPKGANRTHGFLRAQHEALAACFPYRDEDVDMPMFPVFALNNLATGITSVVPRMDFRRVAEVDGAAILEQMTRHAVTTCTASPPFFDRLVEALAASPARPALRRILTGGAPVTREQVRTWRRAWPDTEITVAYGSTEAEPVAHIDADELLSSASDRKGPAGFCMGRPIEQVEARLIRIHRDPVELAGGGWGAWQVEPGAVGELVVTGRHVGRDYYRNPDAVRLNKITAPDGSVWHRMGDTGYFDDGGRFWLVGRVHSTIVRDGAPVHPQLVEQAARADETRIRRVAAVGLPDGRLGQRVVVVVELETAPPDPAQVESEVRDRLARAGLPCDEVRVTTEPLPVDPRHNSKIDYEALLRRLQPT